VQAILILSLSVSGILQLKDTEWTIGALALKALIPALGAGILEELLFRGLLLGVLQRACSVAWACFVSSFIFAASHFLSPTSELAIEDPKLWYVGFELLGSIFAQAFHVQFIAPYFMSLMVLGLLLAGCRIKTGSLYLPIGIHVGFVFALKSFSMLWVLNTTDLSVYFLSADMRSGLLTLISLGIVFVCCELLTSWVKRKNPVE
jgi:membrane protease YdiL (CAAX protease family)